MLFSKPLLSVAALLLVGVSASDDIVFTATRVVNTVTDVAPYIVQATSTVTWTQSPSTSIASATGPAR
ncbi:hypothetical protein B0H11DRAFT_2296329 [Mycena galericulata]|nr:hypothetical protein B0H11DRAFT_2296329 [Mycena galericulata]